MGVTSLRRVATVDCACGFRRITCQLHDVAPLGTGLDGAWADGPHHVDGVGAGMAEFDKDACCHGSRPSQPATAMHQYPPTRANGVDGARPAPIPAPMHGQCAAWRGEQKSTRIRSGVGTSSSIDMSWSSVPGGAQSGLNAGDSSRERACSCVGS